MSNNQFDITRIVFSIGFKSKVHEKIWKRKAFQNILMRKILSRIFLRQVYLCFYHLYFTGILEIHLWL